MPYKTRRWGKQAKERSKKRWKEYRLIAIGKLGGKCVKCGNDDFRVLQIDHINGGGWKERLVVGYKGNYGVISRIINGEKDRYQLLCANCNWIKRYENNENRNGKRGEI